LAYEALLGVGTVRYISDGWHPRNTQVQFRTAKGAEVIWLNPKYLREIHI
jgi:hypothetical protein